jgi:PTS system mannitol-specific IIC component
VSFIVASVILRASRTRDLAAEAAGENSLAAAAARMDDLKGKKSSVSGVLTGVDEDQETRARAAEEAHEAKSRRTPIHNIVFACDAGMGSSAMGASVLRNKLKKAGVEGVTVVNKSIANLDGNEDLNITHKDLTDRARQKNDHAQHVSVDNFMSSPKYDEVVDLVQSQKGE